MAIGYCRVQMQRPVYGDEFAQFTDQDSLRSIDATLVALSSKLNFAQIKIYPAVDFLAHINETALAYIATSVKY